MYNELLKRHEEILKKLTEKASKETDFSERGQFMNLQKMIDAEIKAIRNLSELNDSNNLCAYELGVGKILIGQRGSGVSSTLIDECLKYNRPLIVESKHRAESLSKQYPNLITIYFIRNFEKDCFGLMNTNKEVVSLNKEQVNVELNTTFNLNNCIVDKINIIKEIVGAIGMVGFSYGIDGEEESPIWFHR